MSLHNIQELINREEINLPGIFNLLEIIKNSKHQI